MCLMCLVLLPFGVVFFLYSRVTVMLACFLDQEPEINWIRHEFLNVVNVCRSNIG